MVENFEHDECPKCGTKSEPGENIPDQTLRFCPKCCHDWFEDLSKPPTRGVQTDEDES